MNHKQSGATLVVAMIFLVLMALFAAAAFKSSTGNLRIIGNMQIRQESIAVAIKAIEETISSTLFTTSPTTVAATPITVDIDGDDVADYTATMNPQPACYRTKVIKSKELVYTPGELPSKNNDNGCFSEQDQKQLGSLDIPDVSATVGDSLCANSEWNIGVSVADARTGSIVAANQGVAVRVLTTNAANACP